MRIGDLVRIKAEPGYMLSTAFRDKVGIIIDWDVIYNKYGDPVEKFAIVNWGLEMPAEQEYRDSLEVVNSKWK